MIEFLMRNVDLLATLGSALFGAVALIAAWVRHRRTELRRDDVHRWADESIAALQTLRLICVKGPLPIPAAEERARLAALVFDTSILVERGRMFFRNAGRGEGNSDAMRERAYRGRRAEVLDQLVVAHQIACAWPTAKADERVRMRLVAEDITRRFVSLMQAEVGRTRSASHYAGAKGNGASLAWRMQALDPDRLALATAETWE